MSNFNKEPLVPKRAGPQREGSVLRSAHDGLQTDLKDGGTAAKFSARGLVVWQEWFVEDGWTKALEAVGLSGQDAHAGS